MKDEQDQEREWLEEVIDEACVPVLEEAVAPHLPAIRTALRGLDTSCRPTATEIIERMWASGPGAPDNPP